jgi:hypothetical protein
VRSPSIIFPIETKLETGMRFPPFFKSLARSQAPAGGIGTATYWLRLPFRQLAKVGNPTYAHCIVKAARKRGKACPAAITLAAAIGFNIPDLAIQYER